MIEAAAIAATTMTAANFLSTRFPDTRAGVVEPSV
jgi:hypothetical protein